MHIDLNGLAYILNMRWSDDGHGLVAELVDEGFNFPVVRADIADVEAVLALVERVTGIRPDEETSEDITRGLDELLRDRDLRSSEPDTAPPVAQASGL